MTLNTFPSCLAPKASVSELPIGAAEDVVAVGPVSGLQYVRMTTWMCGALAALELQAFPTADPNDLYDEAELLSLAHDFPEGSVIGFDGPGRDDPVAVGLGVRTSFDFEHPQHNLKDFLAAAPTESGDDPAAPWYYGTDIVVRPDYRRRGIGRELYDLRKQMCIDLDLQGIVAGGVIPGYADHKDVMSADDYVAKVVAGELYDRTLTFQLENGFEAPCALADYIQDQTVNNYASLIVWRNPDYTKTYDKGVG
jgi:GNAT superfamily N-acetyltransferase